LVIAPGERADIIVDFAGMSGKTLTLVNSAKAPYPAGTPADPATVGQIMQFRVNLPLSGVDTTFNPALPGATLRGGTGQSAAVTKLANGLGGLGASVTPDVRRQLTLNEVMGMGGPLEVLLNNSKWGANVSEQPTVGATEVWEIVNLTADAHPIHLHLVQFQLINRQAVNVSRYAKAYAAAFTGGAYMPAAGPPLPYVPAIAGGILGGNPDVTPFLQDGIKPPGANEVGWKDTVEMFPGQVTRIVVRLAPQDVAVGDVSPGINWFPFDPTADMSVDEDDFGFPGGPGYVWHCHIVDHEDNEMMRPLTVAP
jgi:FtsP/CotA-like multicopper oxidase with cupredoxin domain